jgi:hypothetical protein
MKAGSTYTISCRRRPTARRARAVMFGGRSGEKRRSSSTWRISSTRLLCSSTCVEERRRGSGPSSRRRAHDNGGRQCGVEPHGRPAMSGERSVRCATSRRPSRKKEVDKSPTSDNEFVGKVAVVLFTHGWGKVEIRRAHGSFGNEVLPLKGRAMTCFRLKAWLGQRHDEASYHRWPIAGGALDVRQSARVMEGSSDGGRGMRLWCALTWR